MAGLVDAMVLILAVAAVSGLARRRGWNAPVLLVAAGLAASYVPGVPEYRLEPELVLVVMLPPLLYAAAISASLTAVRANVRPIALLSVGLVLFTTVVVGLVAHAVVPGLPLAAAMAFGAIVAPPDAVAASSVGRKLGLPQRVLTILEGESLLNDATALTAFRVSVIAVVTGGFSTMEAAGRFVLAAGGGAAIGLAVAWLVAQLRRHTNDPLLENTLSLLTPFAAYLPAEAVHASGVLAVVICGLVLGHKAPVLMSPAARLQEHAIWSMIEFLLVGIVFALIGLQLPLVIDGLSGESPATITWAAVAVSLAVVVSRPLWVFPGVYLPRSLSRSLRERDPVPAVAVPIVISWAGMRGVVSLAAALGLPLVTDAGEPFPGRDLIVFLTFVVVLVTLLFYGLTLPLLIRRLGLREDPTAAILQEAAAQHRAAGAGLRRLEEALAEGPEPPDGVRETLFNRTTHRQNAAWERLGSSTGETPSATYKRLRLTMVAAEREELVRLRDDGEITDDVLRRMQRDLDLEVALLQRG